MAGHLTRPPHEAVMAGHLTRPPHEAVMAGHLTRPPNRSFPGIADFQSALFYSADSLGPRASSPPFLL